MEEPLLSMQALDDLGCYKGDSDSTCNFHTGTGHHDSDRNFGDLPPAWTVLYGSMTYWGNDKGGTSESPIETAQNLSQNWAVRKIFVVDVLGLIFAIITTDFRMD